MAQRFPCPICGRTFTRHQIDLHVEQCLNNNDPDFIDIHINNNNQDRHRGGLRSPLRRRRNHETNNRFGNNSRQNNRPKKRALLYINLKESTLFEKYLKPAPKGKYYLTLAMDSQKFKCDPSKVEQATGSIKISPKKVTLDWKKQYYIFEISKYFASSALRVTIWKPKTFWPDVPLGMAIIQLGDIRRKQVASLLSSTCKKQQRNKITSSEEKSMDLTSQKGDKIDKKDSTKNHSTLNKEILNEIEVDVKCSYGSVQEHTLQFYKDRIDSSTLSLELNETNKKNLSLKCSLPSKTIYKQRKQTSRNAREVIGEVDLSLWYISELDCIDNTSQDESVARKNNDVTMYTPLHYASMLIGGGKLIQHMMDYFNVKVNGTNVRRGVHNLSPFDIAGLAKKKDAIFVLGNAMVPQDYTMPSSLTVNNDNNNNSDNNNSSGGGTSLHFYCKYGKDVEILQSMVEIRPALVDVLDDFGYTPFLIACKYGKAEFAQFLALQGVRIARKPIVAKNGDTALMLACKGGHEAVVNWLIMREADPNLNNLNDESALMCAASCSKGDETAASLIKLLCGSGAILRTQTDAAKVSTAFHHAASCGHVKAFKTLVEQCNLRLETIANGTKKNVVKDISITKFLALCGNDGKTIYDLFDQYYLKSNLYRGKTKEEINEISSWYENAIELFKGHAHRYLWNGLSSTGECTVDLCGPYGILQFNDDNDSSSGKITSNILSEKIIYEDSDQDYNYEDNNNNNNNIEINIEDNNNNIENKTNMEPLVKLNPSSLKNRDDEEKVADIDESKDNEDDEDVYTGTMMKKLSLHEVKTCTPKTPNESLDVRKKEILDILDIVSNSSSEAKRSKIDPLLSNSITYGFVAYKLHVLKWDVDQVVMDLLSITSTTPNIKNKSEKVNDSIIPSPCKQVIKRTPTLCNVCLEEKSVFYSLECNHLFCKDCWTEHLKTAARTEGERVLVTCKCPQFPNCNYIPDETVWEILAQPNEVKMYQNQLLSSYVKYNSDFINYCPNKRCDRILHISKDIYVKKDDVKCLTCGHNFCFLCGDIVHSPASCEQLKRWKTKSNDDAALLAGWLMKNTKLCPKPGCKERLEKNEGCKHMTCKCNHEFCWDCLRPWSDHDETTGGFFRCAYYDPSKDYEKFDFENENDNHNHNHIVEDEQLDSKLSSDTVNGEVKMNEEVDRKDVDKKDAEHVSTDTKKDILPKIKRHDSAASLANFTFHLKRYTAFDEDQSRASSLYQLFALIQQEQRFLIKKKKLGLAAGFHGKSRKKLYMNFKSLQLVDQNKLMTAVMEVVKMYRTMKFVHVVLNSLSTNKNITSLEVQLILHRMDSRVNTVAELMKAIESAVNADQTYDEKSLSLLLKKVVGNNEAFHEEMQVL